MNLTELRLKWSAKLAEAKKLLDGADVEKGLTPEQKAKYDTIKAEATGLKDLITAQEETEREEKAAAEIPDSQKGIRPDVGPETKAGGITGIHDRELDKPWSCLGDQLGAIATAGKAGQRVDPRLLEENERERKATGAAASNPSDGGFALHPTFSTTIMNRAYTTSVLASRCDVVEIGDNSDSLEATYIDETSRATGQRWGGVQIYRASEAASVTGSNIKVGKMETRLEDLKGIAYVTNRLLQDVVAMSSLYEKAFSDEFGWTLEDEILNGDGVGRCLGILKSLALISVAKLNGQAAGTIEFKNVSQMRSRQWVRSRANSLWLINQDCEPALDTLSLPIGTGGVPVYLPATGAAGQPYDTLYGRPVVPVEQAKTLGTVGDIVLVDLSQYQLIRKGGLQAASSMHVKFVEDEMCFRFTMRVNGQPKWKTALTPANGSNTVSPFVALATRA